MDFRNISNFFGGSILFDDYRLDLQDVEARIGTFVSKSTADDSITVYLLQGLLSAIKGEFASSEALLSLASLLARETGDARLISRCETYEFLLFAITTELPMSRFHDDTDGDWRKLSDAQAGAYARRQKFIENRSVVWSSLTELDLLERDIVNKSAQYSLKLRVGAFPHHPAYHTHTAILFNSSIPFPPPMAAEADRLGLRATSRHLRRLNAEYLLAGASEQGTYELEQLYQECLSDGDLTGAGNCQLILGDNCLSLPFTSPVVLNISLMNRVSSRLTPWHDDLETMHPLRNNARADQKYDRAYELFCEAGSIRGTAAVCFRRGCIALAEYLNSLFLRNGMPIPAPGLVTSRTAAESQLDYALDLYQGDGCMVKLVSAHRIILKILVSCPPDTFQKPAGGAYDAVPDAASIGSWARENANMGIARLAGLLFLGVGRLLSTTHRNLDAASLCCACAKSCFRGAEERILELHATIQHAKLHESCGNMDMARSYLDAGQGVLLRAIDQIDPLTQTVVSNEDRHSLEMIRTNKITDLDSAASSIYAHNPRAGAWKTQLQTLLPGHGGSTVNAMLNSLISNFLSPSTNATSTNPGTGRGTITGVSVAEPAAQELAQPPADESTGQPSMANLFKQFFGGSMDAIANIRQKYYTAIANRKKALVVYNDWEQGQEYLQSVLQSLDQPGGVKSLELYSIRAAVLQHLERYDVIQQWLPEAIPTMFGGRLPTASDKFRELFTDPNPELEAMNQQLIRQHGERSLALCFIAQDWELGIQVLRKIQQQAPDLLDQLHAESGESSWVSMVYIAAIEEHSDNLESSFRWLIKALDVVEASRSKLTDVADRRELLDVIQSAELFAGLARLSLRFPASQDSEDLGQLTDIWAFHGPTWADEALFFLEQGRARVLLDLLTPEQMSQDFLDWSYRLRREEVELRTSSIADARGGDGDLAAYLARLRSDMREEAESPSRAMILARLHQPHFAANATKLYMAIPEDAIVVHINPSRDGVLILYISRKGIELARLSSFTDQRMERHVLQYLKLFKKVNVHNLPSKVVCQALLEELSEEIILPARQLIDSKSHLIFVPSQSLNKFPFSALLFGGEPLFLQKDVSVVPSLSVLQSLVQSSRNRPQDRTSMRAAVIYKVPLKTDRVPLNISAGAAIEIARRLGCEPDPAHKVSLDAFREGYEKSDVVIIGTHGLQSGASAWESNIELQEPLRVLELVRLRSHAALVVFEACVSGVGEGSLGNDVLGFAHSVLSSGASAFLGALWEVSDKASAMLMSFFFRELTATAAPSTTSGSQAPAGPSSLAACLRRAQIRLYQSDARTAKAVLEDFRAACTALDPTHISTAHLKKILNALNAVIAREDGDVQFDYSHPFFWAPFVLVGHASISLSKAI
ncbi:CHAT domain-containing protein [Dactylonectria estremocensis]|uniref:CHAT domain-containing protein n=1 Tax=Dactylonectria estremocensis TaxID=1079267 RepID=A0A9P9EL80_9HYPO|nr:CHAT domain-containing protein [Dactylonectria estremocensis]